MEQVIKEGTVLYKASVLREGEVLEYEVTSVIEEDFEAGTIRVELTALPSGKAMAWITLPHKEYFLTKEEALKS